MTSKKASDQAKDSAQQAAEKPECFIIMPIADRDGYETGHFNRVYEWVVKPACEAAGYEPVRADDVSSSNLIVADILKRIVEAPMAICDISSLNANVMFELGVRQAFGKPVALIKDEKTKSVFDISGLRYTEYASSLRADFVEANVQKIVDMISETQGGAGIISLMALVNIDAAQVPQQTQMSPELQLIIQQMHSLSSSVDSLQAKVMFGGVVPQPPPPPQPQSPAAPPPLAHGRGLADVQRSPPPSPPPPPKSMGLSDVPSRKT